MYFASEPGIHRIPLRLFDLYTIFVIVNILVTKNPRVSTSFNETGNPDPSKDVPPRWTRPSTPTRSQTTP